MNPPVDIRDTVNKAIKASNEKITAMDFATARETQADGERRAAIKAAEGEAQAIKMVSEAADAKGDCARTQVTKWKFRN
jgi:regulator of protease activity HflC (stomatin/prohibitin superfamily)